MSIFSMGRRDALSNLRLAEDDFAQMARRGYERNSAELRRGIAVLVQLANTKPAAPRPQSRARTGAAAVEAQGSREAEVTVLKPRSRRKMH